MNVGPAARRSVGEMWLEISDFQRNSLPVTVFTVGHTSARASIETRGSPLRAILFRDRRLGFDGSADAETIPSRNNDAVKPKMKNFVCFVTMVKPFDDT